MILLILRLGDALSVGFERYCCNATASAEAGDVLDTYSYSSGRRRKLVVAAAAGSSRASSSGAGPRANKVAHLLGEDGVIRAMSSYSSNRPAWMEKPSGWATAAKAAILILVTALVLVPFLVVVATSLSSNTAISSAGALS